MAGAASLKYCRWRYSASLHHWRNIVMWLCSGWDSYQTYEDWCRLEHLHWSYSNLLCPLSSKLTATPRPRTSTIAKSFNNFWSQTSLHDTYWFWSHYDEFCRRSSLKYKACKIAKIDHWIQNGRLPVRFKLFVQETFLCTLAWYMCVPIFVHVDLTGRGGCFVEIL